MIVFTISHHASKKSDVFDKKGNRNVAMAIDILEIVMFSSLLYVWIYFKSAFPGKSIYYIFIGLVSLVIAISIFRIVLSIVLFIIDKLIKQLSKEIHKTA